MFPSKEYPVTIYEQIQLTNERSELISFVSWGASVYGI